MLQQILRCLPLCIAARRPAAAPLLTALFLLGCGGKTSDSVVDSGPPPPKDGAGDEGLDGSDTTDGAWGQPDSGGPWSTVCPEDPPAAGSACTSNAIKCEYGTAWWSVS